MARSELPRSPRASVCARPEWRCAGHVDELSRGPFPDFRIPDLFLAVVIGVANLLSACALWRRHPLSTRASLATGALLMAWVSIQTVIFGFQHWSQGIWWGTFMLVTVLAGLLVRGNTSTRAKVSV